MNRKISSLLFIIGIGIQANAVYPDNEKPMQEENDVEMILQNEVLKSDKKSFDWKTFLEGAGSVAVVGAVPLAILSVYFKSCINELKTATKNNDEAIESYKEIVEKLEEASEIPNAASRGKEMKAILMTFLEEVENSASAEPVTAVGNN